MNEIIFLISIVSLASLGVAVGLYLGTRRKKRRGILTRLELLNWQWEDGRRQIVEADINKLFKETEEGSAKCIAILKGIGVNR